MTVGFQQNRFASLRRRAAYSLAAGAATATLSSDALAEVQYFSGAGIDVGQFAFQRLDVNGDGFQDIKLKNYVFSGTPYQGAFIEYAPGKLVSFSQNSLFYVKALNDGDLIDATTVGAATQGSLAYGDFNPYAEFQNVQDKYIGFSFPAGPNVHYGWVRVDINTFAGTLHIDDWAYEDVAGMGLLAGAGRTAPSLAGDLDGNGLVDGGDVLEVQRGLGETYDAGNFQDVIDDFGKPVEPPAAAAGSPAIGAIPEPGALGLLAVGSLGLTALRRRHERASHAG